MRKVHIYIIVLMLLAINLSAQNERYYRQEARDNFAIGNYYIASENYKVLIEKSGKSSKLLYDYAEACRLDNNFIEAVKSYQYVLNKKPEKFPLTQFWLGESYKRKGQYQKAQIYFKQYYTAHKKDKDYFSKKAKHEILSCEEALFLSFEPKDIVINKFQSPVNSEYSEFSISEFDSSGFYFSSLRKIEDRDTSYFISKIYNASLNNTLWQINKTIDSILNADDYHSADFCLTNNNSTIYFTRCNIDRTDKCKILRSNRVKGVWQNPEELPTKINSGGAKQPAIANTPNGDYLIFVSDRNGSKGKFDLWYSNIDSLGNFDEVKNLGKSVNTIESEVTPFYDKYEETLYFSSGWYNNLGGFDIFKVKGDFNYWGVPENLGVPINSSNNDYFYTKNASREKAYFSSNRTDEGVEGYQCCNDFYYYNLPKEVRDSLLTLKMNERKKKQIKQIVPLTLYFHNDEPNPRTTDTVTDINYENSVLGYIKMLDEYREEFAKGLKKKDKEVAINSVEDFFIDEVEHGYEQLLKFTVLLEDLLDKEQDIIITLKGYTSPLHNTEYNAKLAKRRISSLINFFYSYKNGILLRYIDNGLLTIEQVAIGEVTADTSISDDVKDVRNSVYNPIAAAERRIQIIAVSITE